MNRRSGELRAQWAIGDVLDRVDLAVLLDELTGPTQRLGPGRRWHCPALDHDDHRASVTMHRDRHGHERWRCWSGDHRGDAIDLVVLITGRDRSDAIDWLAARAGMIPDRLLPPIKAKSRTPRAEPAVVMDPAVERYVEVCHRILSSQHGKGVRDWFHSRGFTDATIADNMLGCDPGRALLRRQRGLPYGAEPAAVFPAFDAAGNMTYVQARYLDPDATGRKYDNPAAALAPHPRLSYPIAVSDRPTLIVCEGVPDALTATQAGYPAVGLLGAQTPDDAVATRIANHATNHSLAVVVMCDPDPAGRHLADTVVPLLAHHGVNATTVTPPHGCDLNDWALIDPDWPHHLDHLPDIDTPVVESSVADCVELT